MNTATVCITQRTVRAGEGLLRDCLDQDWSVFLERCGLLPAPVPTLLPDPARFLDRLAPDGLILSGGNDLGITGGPDASPERDALEGALLSACAARGLPVLGVCRGMQMMNVHLGGGLRPVPGHAGTRHPVHLAPETDMPGHPDVRTANSYHKYGLMPADLAPGLVPLMTAPDGTVEAFRHDRLPFWGVMWHPERGQPSPFDIALVRSILLPGQRSAHGAP